jgi:hypothetical protein
MALRAEDALTQARDHHRSAMAQTAYTYIHLPIVGGIALAALGMEHFLEYVGGHGHHNLSDPLTGIPWLHCSVARRSTCSPAPLSESAPTANSKQSEQYLQWYFLPCTRRSPCSPQSAHWPP